MDLSAYRIVQEALTNVLRHVPGASATVTIDYGRHDMTVEVCDDGGDGTSTAASAGGNGIVGMRERVALFGGEFHAGPIPGGGFRVRARLPYREQPR